jgi:broad specificity phosphatase PhoE
MTNIYLVRHGEAQGNKYRIFHGISDADLTSNGILQAEKAAAALMGLGIEKIYSSDLRRACETAKVFSQLSGIGIITSKGLREIDGGMWENKPWHVLPVMFPEEYHTWENEPHLHKMPGGESIQDLYDRGVDELIRISEDNADKTIAIFTHGTLIRVLMCYLYKRDLTHLKEIPWCENTSITKIRYKDKCFDIEYEGRYDHLDPSEATVLNQKWNIGGDNDESV